VAARAVTAGAVAVMIIYTKILKHTATVGFWRSHFDFLAVETVEIWQK
jgi:hypothetical protein